MEQRVSPGQRDQLVSSSVTLSGLNVNEAQIAHILEVCDAACSRDRELIFWVDRKAPVWAIQVSPTKTWTERKKSHAQSGLSAVLGLTVVHFFCL